jgi:hypothetical protein
MGFRNANELAHKRPRVRWGQRYHEHRDRLTETLRIAMLGTPEVAEPKRALTLVKT